MLNWLRKANDPQLFQDVLAKLAAGYTEREILDLVGQYQPSWSDARIDTFVADCYAQHEASVEKDQ